MITADKLDQAHQLLRQAEYIVALTGAGVSTPSGIPDFRSPGSGIWERFDQMEIASLSSFRRYPGRFYQWLRPALERMLGARPNPAHIALAQLESAEKLQVVLTQNIDGLHQRAGSRHVVELHGHLRETTCIQCYRTTPGDEVVTFLRQSDGIPTCAACGGVLKPNVILYGEQLPFDAIHSARQEARRCDLMVVAGSSLTVEPAASLPAYAREHGARTILINLQPTYLDSAADLIFYADVAEVLPMLAQPFERSE